MIVFDTAPTGHTLRLLELPVDWSKQLNVKVFASVDSAVADGVAKQRFGPVIDMMRDSEQSTFAFVMYPEATPIIEAYRAAQELRTVGVEPGLVVANFVIPPEQATTPFSHARRAMQEKSLAEIGERFGVPILTVPLLPCEVEGLELLKELGERLYGRPPKLRKTQDVSFFIALQPLLRGELMTRKVLFLCTGNSCRSQMAEAIVNARLGDEWEAVSAGTEPAGYVHPLTLRALAEIGIEHH